MSSRRDNQPLPRLKPRIPSPFEYVAPTVQDRQSTLALRQSFESLFFIIKERTPEGSYQSLALIALENACTHAIKAVTHTLPR